jgi:hypothetical protein
MAITPIKPGCEPELRSYLEKLSQSASPFAKLPRTHFARWVILSDWVNEADQPRQEHLSGEYLIFSSTFDGALESYLDELCELLAAEAAEIWGRCIGSPSAAGGPALKAYLLHNQIDIGFFVAAYPRATVAKVKQSLARREQLSEFAVDSQGMAPAELQAAFQAEFNPQAGLAFEAELGA